MKIIFIKLSICIFLFSSIDINAQLYEAPNGNVGIGTRSPAKKLDIEGGSLRVRYSNTSPYRRRQFLINTTASDPRLESERFIVFFNTPRASFIDIYAKTLYERSDKNDKENISIINKNYLDDLSKLDAVSYTWKSDKSKKKEIGFLAQDVEKVFPELVRNVEGIEGKSISYSHMVPILVEAIKTQKEMIENLSAKVTKLENQIASNNIPANSSKSRLIKAFPNPSDGEVTLELFIAKDIATAAVKIFNSKGQELASHPVSERGNTSITINSTKLTNGIHFYSLLINNKKVDSQKVLIK
ncbi:tail fiber domain-containing protein [Aquimarina aquimarini]|uniref:tail fiber domain-containing protein n=1 Tax=Aquimarina aquimarini TaxID=1191734 RepID=UPI00131F2AB1|nr:tail fiber domain-containing protein [Aquimarina aquimarini]